MNKLVMKLATFTFALVALLMVTLPVYAAVAIDYTNEAVTGLETKHEYSTDKKTWNHIFEASTSVDISKIISKDKVVNFYYREIGKTAATDIKTLPIPKRPAAPKGLKFVPSTVDISKDVINTTASHQYKYGISVWETSPSTGVAVANAEVAGAKILVRTKPGSAFASLPVLVNVPKFPTVPKTVKYDIKKDVIVVGSGMEYQVLTAAQTKKNLDATKWKAVVAKQTFLDRAAINKLVTPDNAAKVFVRVKGTASKAASAFVEVYWPAAEAIPTSDANNFVMSIADEKIMKLPENVEYRVLTDKTKATATYATPAWKSVTGEELDISKMFSPSTSKAPNTLLQLRKKYVTGDATAQPATLDKPASKALEFKIKARAATPKITDVKFNYTFGKETITLPTGSEYQIVGVNETYVATAGAVNIKDNIPAAGSPALALNVRIKAVSLNGVYTPASAVFKTAKIAAQPKAPGTPTLVLTKTKKAVTGVSDKMEYQLNPTEATTSWSACSGSTIDLSSQKAGASVTLKVRLKYTEKAPASAAKDLSGSVPE